MRLQPVALRTGQVTLPAQEQSRIAAVCAARPPLHVVLAPPPADVLLLCMKTFQVEDAARQLPAQHDFANNPEFDC